jgi:hypothetical protein
VRATRERFVELALGAADLTLEETRQLFSGDGLIPDIPAP